MNTPDIRRAVLRTLINRDFEGISRRLALHLGKPDGQINDMLATPPRKSFGERIARTIEDLYPLPPGYLDQIENVIVIDTPNTALKLQEPEPPTYARPQKYSKQALAVAAYYDMLPVDQQAEFEAALVAICLGLPVEKRTELAKIITLFR